MLPNSTELVWRILGLWKCVFFSRKPRGVRSKRIRQKERLVRYETPPSAAGGGTPGKNMRTKAEDETRDSGQSSSQSRWKPRSISHFLWFSHINSFYLNFNCAPRPFRGSTRWFPPGPGPDAPPAGCWRSGEPKAGRDAEDGGGPVVPRPERKHQSRYKVVRCGISARRPPRPGGRLGDGRVTRITRDRSPRPHGTLPANSHRPRV